MRTFTLPYPVPGKLFGGQEITDFTDQSAVVGIDTQNGCSRGQVEFVKVHSVGVLAIGRLEMECLVGEILNGKPPRVVESIDSFPETPTAPRRVMIVRVTAQRTVTAT